MSQLSQNSMKKIEETISYSCFSTSDFEIQFPKSGQNLLVLTFKHKPDYEFRIIEKMERSKVKVNSGFSSYGPTTEKVEEYLAIFTKESPGSYKSNQEREADRFDDAVERIKDWCANIKDDLSITFEDNSGFEEIRKQFEQQFVKFAGNENERFNSEELDSLNQKFDSLLAKFESLQEENKITKEEINKVKKEIQGFKSNAKSFPKGVWAKVTNNRLVDLLISLAKSKEGRQLIVEEVRKTIGI